MASKEKINAPKNLGGRPSILNNKLADEICSKISQGYTLRQLEKLEEMPDKSTILRWASTNDDKYKQFQDQYEKALATRAEVWAEEILDISDDGSNDWMERENKDGSTFEVVNNEHIQRSRLRVDARKWLLSKALPKKYGDKQEVKHEGGISITLNTPIATNDQDSD